MRVLTAFHNWQRRDWQGSWAQKLWQLWLDELSQMMPARLRRRTRISTLAWPLEADSQELSDSVGVLLGEDQALVLRLNLPAAAARNLHEVMHYELDRYTPFQVKDVCYDCRVLTVNERYVEVELALVTRAQMDEIIQACTARQLTLKSVDVKNADGEPLRLNLLPYDQRHERSSRQRYLSIGLTVLCVGLVVAYLQVYLSSRQTQLESAQQQVQQLEQQLNRIQLRTNDYISAQKSVAWITQQKNTHPSTARVLAALAECLPADTWIRNLDINSQSVISITGLSGEAGQLIASIDACHQFRQPRFEGVIQPDTATGKQRFSMTLHWPEATP